jgi:surface polysaccharide O-acyltransferase-like enzyme
MNDAYLHLVINHFPIFSMLFGLLILSWGLWKKSTGIKNIAFVLFILGGITSYVAVETGENAEDVVEEYVPTISHDAIHDHEEAAEIALWFSIVTGGLGLISLFSGNFDARFRNVLMGVLFITAVAAVGTLGYTAYEGGKIRHPEAHTTAQADIQSSLMIEQSVIVSASIL